MKIQDIDFDAVWKDTMGWNTPCREGRKFQDAVELAFWEKLAPSYTEQYNLNHDTPLIAEWLKENIGNDQSILEIGCGSGNFTMEMAPVARSILGLDFSTDMLREMEKRAAAHGYTHIRGQVGKWEDFSSCEHFGSIVSVNSLYRIEHIEAALLKMWDYGDQVLIVRTIQRSLFYSIYKALGILVEECRDYQILPQLFWSHGIHADVEYTTYPIRRQYPSWEAVEEQMKTEIGIGEYEAHKKECLYALRLCQVGDQPLTLELPRTTVLIQAKK